MKLFDRIASRLNALRRMYSIYCELGYVPWRKPSAPRKKRKRKNDGFMNGSDLIPFFNNDGKRTVSHLLLRPGYMIRDYVVRGDHENYFAPLTALLVFYSVFTLLLAIVQPGEQKPLFTQGQLNDFRNIEITATVDSIRVDSTQVSRIFADRLNTLGNRVADVIELTHMDLYPEAADKPWKQSLAAFESNLRSKGVPMFLWGFLWLWILLWRSLRKHKIGFSGAAAMSAYVMCQFCVFKFLATLLTIRHPMHVDLLLYALALVIDFHQLLQVSYGKAIRMTLGTGLRFVLYVVLLGILALVGFSLYTLGPDGISSFE
jgi:hypothetical protein